MAKKNYKEENFYVAYIKFFFVSLREMFNSLKEVWKLSRVQNAPISIFGGTHLKENSVFMQKAHELAEMLADADMPVLTGGGPGIMEAASCGVAHTAKKIVATVGITIKGLDPKEFKSRCRQDTIFTYDFFSRKKLLIMHSVGFAIFPGGYGTLNEFLELLTNIQTRRRPSAPIVLIGVEYWTPFIKWIKEFPLKMGLITEADFSLFTVTDDIKEAFEILRSSCPHRKFSIFLRDL